MRFLPEGFRADVVIAVLVLLVSGSASAFIFERISLQHEGRTATIAGIELGERKYALLSQEGCAGSFTVKLTVSREESSLSISGKVKLAAGQNTFTPAVSGDLSFNNLGQLGGSVFRVNAEGMEIVFGTKGLRKMQGILRTTAGSSKTRIDVPIIAGPFTLVRQPDGRYEISGSLPESLKPFQPGLMVGSLLDSYSLHREEGKTQCDTDNMVPVDLNPVLNRLGSLLHL